MEKFIGVKVIKAVEQEKHLSTMGDCEEGIQGYKVVYEDGYTSWSPKDVFDKAYRSTKGMTFGLAIEAMKEDKKIKLPFWGEDVFISIQEPNELSKMTHSYMYVTSRFGLVPWTPTQVEILSEDWQIVE